MDRALETTVIEARAKIIWGDDHEAVRAWLMDQEVDLEDIDVILRMCRNERNSEIRRRGRREILVGLALMTVGVLGVWMMIHFDDIFGVGFAQLGKIPIVLLLVGVWGCYRCLKGAVLLFSPGKINGSITEL